MKEENDVSKQQKLEKALLKKALGYEANEVVEEYSVGEDGSSILTKRKITKKHVSPDIPAAKILLTHYGARNAKDYASLSDEDLYKEKMRLIKLLKEEEEEDDNN